MHDSKLGCQSWLLAIFVVVSNPKARSSVQLAADLGICQKSAWHLGHRIREALRDGGMFGFDGPVEADETYIGDKAHNWSVKRRERLSVPRGRPTAHKTAVAGVKDRPSGKVTAVPVADASSGSLLPVVASAARPGATVFTDEWRSYRQLSGMGYDHQRVTHGAREYVRGDVHTNGIENYWSHMKRTYIGTYHYMSPEHLHRYVTEHSFRYNRRKVTVLNKMSEAAQSMDRRSLTWRELTGSVTT